MLLCCVAASLLLAISMLAVFTMNERKSYQIKSPYIYSLNLLYSPIIIIFFRKCVYLGNSSSSLCKSCKYKFRYVLYVVLDDERIPNPSMCCVCPAGCGVTKGCYCYSWIQVGVGTNLASQLHLIMRTVSAPNISSISSI